MDGFSGISLCVLMAVVLPPVVTKRACEEISVPLCKDVGYNMTSMPNMFNHNKQEDAGMEIHQFFPLVKVQCSPSLKPLLCLLYVPLCTIDSTRLPPCRSVCARAKTGCGALFRKFGFQWPEKLACDQLPESGECLDYDEATGNLLYKPRVTTTIATTTTTAQLATEVADAPRKRPKVNKSSEKTSKKQLQVENLELDNERLKLSIKKLETEEEKLQLEKQYLAIKIRHLEAMDSK